MGRPEPIKKGSWVLRNKPLVNDDQELFADSVGRVSGSDGSLTVVAWLGPRQPFRVPVYHNSLKSLNGQAGRFDAVLIRLDRIRREFLLIERGDPPHLHSHAIRNMFSVVLDHLGSRCPEAARKAELAIGNFEYFCKTKDPNSARWFRKNLSESLNALPWISVTG
jgi:hypothetical protein